MDLQIIKSSKGHSEYVAFKAEDYIDNPVALARIKAHMTQEELAKRLGVTQAYISKIENQETVSFKVLERIKQVLSSKKYK